MRRHIIARDTTGAAIFTKQDLCAHDHIRRGQRGDILKTNINPLPPAVGGISCIQRNGIIGWRIALGHGLIPDSERVGYRLDYGVQYYGVRGGRHPILGQIVPQLVALVVFLQSHFDIIGVRVFCIQQIRSRHIEYAVSGREAGNSRRLHQLLEGVLRDRMCAVCR